MQSELYIRQWPRESAAQNREREREKSKPDHNAPASSITNKISPVKQRVRDARRSFRLKKTLPPPSPPSLLSYSFPSNGIHIYNDRIHIYTHRLGGEKKAVAVAKQLRDNCIPIVRDRSRAPIDRIRYCCCIGRNVNSAALCSTV